MDALVILLVQLTVQVVLALAQLAMMAAVLLGRILVVAWRGWRRRQRRRAWR